MLNTLRGEMLLGSSRGAAPSSAELSLPNATGRIAAERRALSRSATPSTAELFLLNTVGGAALPVGEGTEGERFRVYL
jgi:hypothetical protein